MIKLYKFTEDEKESFKKVRICFDNNKDNYRMYEDQLKVDLNQISDEFSKYYIDIQDIYESTKRNIIWLFKLYMQLLNEKRYSGLTEEEKQSNEFMNKVIIFFQQS